MTMITIDGTEQERGLSLEEKMQVASIGTLLIHPIVFFTGMYQGFQSSRGNHGASPFIPLWIANTIGTAYFKSEDQLERYVSQRRVITGQVHNPFVSIENHKRMTKEFLENSRSDAVIGAGIGAVITPIEYLIGWGTGMAIGRINEVFS